MCEPTSFWRENVVADVILPKTSLYQMLGILSFSDRDRALPPSMELSELTFVLKKKYNEAFRGVFL